MDRRRARARWEEFTDPKLHKKLEIKRTKHYLILYNAGGNLFAKKMEEFYKEVQKVYPFDEVEGRRLMPVFLFRTKRPVRRVLRQDREHVESDRRELEGARVA